MNLVFFLLLQISSLVKDNHDLTMKYSETKNKLQDLSSKLKSDPMKENEREGILEGNIYDATKVRTTMKEMGLKMTPFFNFIEVNNKVHAFLVEDITSLI